MRITGLRGTPLAVPFVTDEVWAYGRRSGLISVLVHVDTDEGPVGIGEAAAYPSTDIVLAVLKAVEPLVVGEDPFRIERIMKRINVVGTWHHVKATSPAIAAVEMACWDIVGKACGQPLVNLFGGRVRDEVDYFYYLGQRAPDELVDAAKAGRERGFRTFYLKVGSDDPRVDIARVEAIRKGAGDDALIRVDANEAWSSAAAIRIIGEMEQVGLELVEQPVSGRNLPEMAYVRSRIATPLLANEASWTRWDQLAVIQQAAADAVSVDNQMDGGLSNLRHGAAMCEVAGLPVLKHSLGELGIATYAGLHVLAATPNVTYASQGYGSLLADDILAERSPLPYVDGRLAVPDAPGIGVDLDEDRVARAAERYEREADRYAFHDPRSMAATPVLPKF
jgi:L-alanine-DL-glutamate epimerase-like enolase superfamily enzyme